MAVLNGTAQQPQLDLHIGRDRAGQSFVRRQYATYPFRLSRALRLDPMDTSRTYLYMMNSSPGLLADDVLELRVRLDDQTSLYLTDQSATKVHTMPADRVGRLSYNLHIGAGATLEFVPEPLLLYRDANLEQTVTVTLDPTGRLFLGEIIVPGRLARGECYQFRHCLSRLQVSTPDGSLVFADAMQLSGHGDRVTVHPLFAPLPILASVIIVLPGIDLQPLQQTLAAFAKTIPKLMLASSRLPNCNGLLVRAMAENVSTVKLAVHCALNSMRRVSDQPPLPEIPK
ncbi:urease accessory protein UreD [Stenomitos frigidus]|nr:urease accessory protein UreD [Stenomitos frigidus]